MMVLCNANVNTEHDKRRSGLSYALLNVEYGNNITEESTNSHISKHTTEPFHNS